ncbi:MAG: glycosyltransferase family 2 protein [Actinobacteria bacterium]|nr:glycosyltransferase family 2 protein [Actinomycetota bacterium]
MAAPKFTILTPTFDNGPTLEFAIESVRRQSIEDWEHVIVGDGCVEAAREIATRYAAEDPRASFIDNVKGERHGERHRHEAIQRTSGELICYIGDDDLWFGDHLARLLDLVEGVDFAHSVTVAAFADGSYYPHFVDLNLPYYRERMLIGDNWISPTTVVHRRDAYERLPLGWSPSAENVYADLVVWQQFLRNPEMRFRGSGVVTAVNLPRHDPTRQQGEEARIGQLREWAARLADPTAAAQVREAVAEEIYLRAAHHQADAMHLHTS